MNENNENNKNNKNKKTIIKNEITNIVLLLVMFIVGVIIGDIIDFTHSQLALEATKPDYDFEEDGRWVHLYGYGWKYVLE